MATHYCVAQMSTRFWA